jgi:hypothetical protein
MMISTTSTSIRKMWGVELDPQQWSPQRSEYTERLFQPDSATIEHTTMVFSDGVVRVTRRVELRGFKLRKDGSPSTQYGKFSYTEWSTGTHTWPDRIKDLFTQVSGHPAD